MEPAVCVRLPTAATLDSPLRRTTGDTLTTLEMQLFITGVACQARLEASLTIDSIFHKVKDGFNCCQFLPLAFHSPRRLTVKREPKCEGWVADCKPPSCQVSYELEPDFWAGQPQWALKTLFTSRLQLAQQPEVVEAALVTTSYYSKDSM
ncbi:hypothetical protein TREES_T100014218 [Tupaia chinensis]|uniref:Uncharacterized protein n=1 Tax=Tupaia chinensis TaxID=246437 RepID=L9KL03_TUPCH|nr:hypothetical protein TREES_T100014218 [Tupaia chinensis]